MLFNKSIFVVAMMALTNVVAANTVQTPACVLKIIGNQPNPADSKTICGSDASKIQSDISKSCPDSEASLKFFSSNCAQLGHKVASSSSTTTATGTATGTSGGSTATGSATGSATATGFVTAISSGSATQTGSSAGATGTSGSAAGSAGSSSGTGTAAGSTASPTFNAASSDRQFSATTFVAAVFLGAAALL